MISWKLNLKKKTYKRQETFKIEKLNNGIAINKRFANSTKKGEKMYDGTVIHHLIE